MSLSSPVFSSQLAVEYLLYFLSYRQYFQEDAHLIIFSQICSVLQTRAADSLPRTAFPDLIATEPLEHHLPNFTCTERYHTAEIKDLF